MIVPKKLTIKIENSVNF